MAKKNTKSAAQQAAEEMNAPEEHVTTPVMPDMTAAMQGMDINRRVDLMTNARVFFHDDRAGALKAGFSDEFIDNMNGVNMAMVATTVVEEVLTSKTPFALTVQKGQLKALQDIAKFVGFRIDEKLLPAPDANGNIALPSTAVVVDEKTKKAVAEEKKIRDEKPTLNPVEIKTVEDERKALIFILSDQKVARPVDRIMKAINFKTALMQIAANKLENEEAKTTELDRIKALNVADIFRDITNTIGPAPFAVSGLAKFMFDQTASYTDPTVAFCLLRKASINRKNNEPVWDDATIAAIVKVLIYWTTTTKVAENNKDIKEIERRINKRTADLKKSKTSEKEIKKANAEDEEMIAKCNANIEYTNKINDLVAAASGDFANNFIDIYKNKEDKLNYYSHKVASNICDCYMPQVTFSKNDYTVTSKLDEDSLLKNVQQYVGIIANHFRGAGAALVGYSEANIVEITVEEEKPAEEEGSKK